MKLNKTLNEKAYIYCIKYNNLPIYIGSTLNIENREKSHNRHLKNAINNRCGQYYLYDYIVGKKIHLNIKKIELVIIKELYNDIVIIGENIFEYRRNIEEERCIINCLNRGYALLNMVYPCVYRFDENNELKKIKEEASYYLHPRKERINLDDYKIDKNMDVYNYVKSKIKQKELDELLKLIE